jgi:cyclohexyl-isocyanide hydratase
MSIDQLEIFGAKPVKKRIVRDRNRITGGGVTAGIDFALYLASVLVDEQTARMIQLSLEYNPEPPFTSGSPDSALPETVSAARTRAAHMLETRRVASLRAAERLKAYS